MLVAVLREFVPPDRLKTMVIEDCQFDRACVENAAARGALAVDQSSVDDEPVLPDRAFVINFDLISSVTLRAN
jgi:hypothetical protein